MKTRVLSAMGVGMAIILPLERCDVLTEQIKKGPKDPFSSQEVHDEWVNQKLSLINTYLDLVTGLLDEWEITGEKFKQITTNHLGEPMYTHLRAWLQEQGRTLFESWENRE